jgi:hypothetical protein
LHFPALFSSMILLDPMIDTFAGSLWEHIQFVIGRTLIRRQHWPSREDALRSFKSSPFFLCLASKCTSALCRSWTI